MSETVIRVENLGKKYIIGHQKQEQYTALRDVMANGVKSLVSKFGRSNGGGSNQVSEEFWALKDVSFEIKQGDRVGIIGRNGAGKSTLLKILSRITEPTTGSVRIKGRVASLLEVGTGFHPELTGRENVYLNGSILGMSRVEIKSKFDEIVSFAEIEKFLDTPVKRYSSGMYVRLAFAVAAHLQTDILVVDEVLAVGDAEFQKKCMGKMEEVSTGHGRTVLFVSHNLGAIVQLCNRSILLDRGKLLLKGHTAEVVNEYLDAAPDSRTRFLSKGTQAKHKCKKVEITVAYIVDRREQESYRISVSDTFAVHFRYSVPEPLENLELSVRILNKEARPVLTSLLSESSPNCLSATSQGKYEACVEFPAMLLMPGDYFVNIAAHESVGELFDLQERALAFSIEDTGTIFAKYGNYSEIGVVLQKLTWDRKSISAPV